MNKSVDTKKRCLYCPCGNGYDNSDSLEYHLRKEHTKGELAHYLKKEAQSKLV